MRIHGLYPLLLASSLLLASEPAPGANAPNAAKGPVLRIASPKDGAGFLMRPGSETKLLVTLEITDVTGSGIETDDMGTPKFYEPDDNADLFRSNIVAKGTYMNHLGQTVIQLTAELPAQELKITKDGKMTPPFDVPALTEEQRKKGFDVPPEAMVDVADFHFRVRDRSGAISPAEAEKSQMFIGIAWQLYAPAHENVLPEEVSKKALERHQKTASSQEADPLVPKAPKPQAPPDSH